MCVYRVNSNFLPNYSQSKLRNCVSQKLSLVNNFWTVAKISGKVAKAFKIYIFRLENNLYLNYSHKGVRVRVKEKYQYPNCKACPLAKTSGEHYPDICLSVQFFRHNFSAGPSSYIVVSSSCKLALLKLHGWFANIK